MNLEEVKESIRLLLLKNTSLKPQQRERILLSLFQDNYDYFIGDGLTKNIPQTLDSVLRVIWSFDYTKVKVVILGQDPYPSLAKANGISFWDESYTSWSQKTKTASMNNFVKSLARSFLAKDSTKYINIEEAKKLFSENNIDSVERFFNNSIKQGVLWLNTALTMRINPVVPVNTELAKHLEYWKHCINELFNIILENNPNTIFLLMGSKAENYFSTWEKYNFVHGVKNYSIITTLHPRMAYFQNDSAFFEVNKALEKKGLRGIEWL